MWASYDGSTNAPVVYPNGTSIAAIESQMLMQVTSITLAARHTSTRAYTTQLTGTGGSGPPYTWTLAPGSPACAVRAGADARRSALRHPGGDRHLLLFRADDATRNGRFHGLAGDSTVLP